MSVVPSRLVLPTLLLVGISLSPPLQRVFRPVAPPQPSAAPASLEATRQELEQENVRLKALLGFKAASPHRPVVAQVLARDLVPWRSAVIVGRGQRAGVTPHQPVVTPQGLVGQVIEVAPHTSRVLLINDVDSRVSVLIQRTRQPGMLVGTALGGCWIQWLAPDADVATGDLIITSGLGPVYPKGLVVGTVEAIETDPAGLSKQAQVKPAVALDRLEEVVILR